MTFITHIRWILLIAGLILLSACDMFYEVDTDLRARLALRELMRVQEEYRKDHPRYAKTLFEIETEGKYKLEYHKGLVYMEIESADESGYRAVSLPAESTTARVFAYDSAKGGFYELGEEETAQYVLGAFRFIQQEKHNKQISDISSGILVAGVAFFGIHAFIRRREPGYGLTYAAHFLSLGPLCFSLTTLSHMTKNIVFSSTLNAAIYGSIGLSTLCLGIFAVQVKKYYIHRGETSIVGMLASISLSSLFTIGVMLHTLTSY